MNINCLADSNAVALDGRNFGAMEPGLAKYWMAALVKLRNETTPSPAKAVIELCNTCNLDCPMCRVGEHGVDLTRTMPLRDFSQLLDQMPSIQTVRLNGLGESTLVPSFPEYVEELSRRDISIELISNATGPMRFYEAVLDAGGYVYLSWDSANPAQFETLRRPARWDQCFEILQSLSGYAGAEESAAVLFTLQPANIGQLPDIVTLAASVGISRVIVNVAKMDRNKWVYENINAIKDVFERSIAVAVAQDIVLVAPDQIAGHQLGLKQTMSTCGSHCKEPWREVVIRWNGDVQVCNMFNPYTYGNINLNGFEAIWSNRFATLFRLQLNTEHAHPYCKNCVYIPDAYAFGR